MGNGIKFYRAKSTTWLMQDLQDNEISLNYNNRSLKNVIEIINSLEENKKTIKEALRERGENVYI